MARESLNVIVGIDTHADTHHVGIVTDYGKPLADREFLTVSFECLKIPEFISSHGTVVAVGVEETGFYDAELARVLREEGQTVMEVKRANRAQRRLKGKPDLLDACQATQSVLVQRGVLILKRQSWTRRMLTDHPYRTFVGDEGPDDRVNQIRALLISAPDALRARNIGQWTSRR